LETNLSGQEQLDFFAFAGMAARGSLDRKLAARASMDERLSVIHYRTAQYEPQHSPWKQRCVDEGQAANYVTLLI
jgi:hypothetical protein